MPTAEHLVGTTTVERIDLAALAAKGALKQGGGTIQTESDLLEISRHRIALAALGIQSQIGELLARAGTELIDRVTQLHRQRPQTRHLSARKSRAQAAGLARRRSRESDAAAVEQVGGGGGGVQQTGGVEKVIRTAKGEEEMILRNSGSLSGEDDEMVKQFLQSQGRNKYIQKISSLLSFNSSQASFKEEPSDPRNSAKSTRERKKKYIELLQRSSRDCSQQILQLDNKIVQKRNQLLSLLKHHEPQVHDSIARSLPLAQPTHSLTRDAFLYRFGFNGVNRMRLFEHLKKLYLQQINQVKVIANQDSSFYNKFSKELQLTPQKIQQLDPTFSELSALGSRLSTLLADCQAVARNISSMHIALASRVGELADGEEISEWLRVKSQKKVKQQWLDKKESYQGDQEDEQSQEDWQDLLW